MSTTKVPYSISTRTDDLSFEYSGEGATNPQAFVDKFREYFGKYNGIESVPFGNRVGRDGYQVTLGHNAYSVRMWAHPEGFRISVAQNDHRTKTLVDKFLRSH